MTVSQHAPGVEAGEALLETAASWHDRLNSGNAADDRLDFERWLARSPAHRAAYESVERGWKLARGAAEDPAILALRHETALRLTRRSSRWTFARASLAAGVALLLAGSAAWLSFLSADRSVDRAPVAELLQAIDLGGSDRYVTRIGERLMVSLADGSRVTLNTQTELREVFDATERKVVLEHGQALFEVARDPARSFVVEAHGRRFVALGTAFDVRVEGRRVQVTMLEGTVGVEHVAAAREATRDPRVAAVAASPERVTTLTAGEQLTAEGAHYDRVRIANPEQVTSWRRGQVIFEDSRLIDAIAEINRYSQTRIELADPALAELRLSGAFATGRPDVFIEALTAYFPIEVSRREGEVIALSARH